MPDFRTTLPGVRAFSRLEKRFAARLPRVRDARGMSQREVAAAAGMHRTALGSVEHGRRGIQLGEAALLCEALGVPLADMLSSDPLVLRVDVAIE
jgi:transcriptional regulator with XRE-family HTH domain